MADASGPVARAREASADMTQILLVEDEPGIQLAMRGLLRRDGYEVRVASTGKEALEAIEGDGCDLRTAGAEHLGVVERAASAVGIVRFVEHLGDEQHTVRVPRANLCNERMHGVNRRKIDLINRIKAQNETPFAQPILAVTHKAMHARFDLILKNLRVAKKQHFAPS